MQMNECLKTQHPRERNLDIFAENTVSAVKISKKLLQKRCAHISGFAHIILVRWKNGGRRNACVPRIAARTDVVRARVGAVNIRAVSTSSHRRLATRRHSRPGPT